MILANITNQMNYTLKVFNTGQITLPKKWRDKFTTKNFIAEETPEGLLIKPIEKDEIVYYENDKEFGIYCEKGMDPQVLISAIKKMHG